MIHSWEKYKQIMYFRLKEIEQDLGIWKKRYFGCLNLPNFPEHPLSHLWQKRYLPPPMYHNGEWELAALQAFEQKRTSMPFAFASNWQHQLHHLLYQEETHHRVLTIPTTQLLEHEKEDCQELEMNMRPNVDKRQKVS